VADRLRGNQVILRRFRPDEFETVWESRQDLDAPPGLFASKERLRRLLERSGNLVDGRLDFAIEADGRLVGEIDARQPKDALPPGVFELGLTLFRADDRGRGYGSEAVALLTDYLFSVLGAERVQASTAVSNTAMRRVLEKLGFVEEGVMRSFMPGQSGRYDYALYGVTKEDWRART
jgi:RimJ/RimL family protein N-acetyltransferase